MWPPSCPLNHSTILPRILSFAAEVTILPPPLATDTQGGDLLRLPAQEECQRGGEEAHSKGLSQHEILPKERPQSFSLCSGLGLQYQEISISCSNRNDQNKNLSEKNAAIFKVCSFVLFHSSIQASFLHEIFFLIGKSNLLSTLIATHTCFLQKQICQKSTSNSSRILSQIYFCICVLHAASD